MMNFRTGEKVGSTTNCQSPVSSLLVQDESVLISDEWSRWLHPSAQWTHCLTVLVNQRRSSEASLIATAKHFDIVLNRMVYRKCHRKQDVRLASIYAYGFGDSGDNPHFHGCIAAPNLQPTEFESMIWSAAQKLRSAKHPINVTPYRDGGWISYIGNRERHTVILELLHLPQLKFAS